MAKFGEAEGLIAALGTSIGIPLNLDEQGEAAIECGNGIIVGFAAAPAARAVIVEGRRSRSSVPAGADGLRQALALNRRAEIGAAAVAMDLTANALITRQFISVGDMDAKIFANLINAFVVNTVFAFQEIDLILQDSAADSGAAPVQATVDDMVVFRP